MAINILIVDDSVLTRKAIRRILDMLDLPIGEVYEAQDGLDALQILEQKRVGMIMADLHMPRLDGKEFIKKVKESKDKSSIPIFVFSAESNDACIKELLSQGINGFLHKPFTPEKVRETVMANIGR